MCQCRGSSQYGATDGHTTPAALDRTIQVLGHYKASIKYPGGKKYLPSNNTDYLGGLWMAHDVFPTMKMIDDINMKAKWHTIYYVLASLPEAAVI